RRRRLVLVPQPAQHAQPGRGHERGAHRALRRRRLHVLTSRYRASSSRYRRAMSSPAEAGLGSNRRGWIRSALRPPLMGVAALRPPRMGVAALRPPLMGVAATCLRACASDANRPAVTACTSTLPITVASTGPATTGRPVASAVAW